MLSIRSSFKPARLASVAFAAVALCASLLGIASCSMMHDDIDPCPPTPTRDTGLFVRFVYDYNMQRADMFKDHVGYVLLNVFDESGKLAAQRKVSNLETEAPLAEYGYTMHFTNEELPAGHRYRLQAIGMQKNWDDALLTPGAKYRMNTSVKDTADVRISLDRDQAVLTNTQLHAVSTAAPLDTLWHTLKVTTDKIIDMYDVDSNAGIAATTAPFSIYPIDDQLVSVEEGNATYATVSLIRDTKHLTITVRQIEHPDEVFASDFKVTLVDANPLLGSDNVVLESDSVLYRPYASWTTRFDKNGTTIEGESNEVDEDFVGEKDADLQRTAHYSMMFNRLMFNKNDIKKNARLLLRNRKTDEVIANINLPYTLAEDVDYHSLQRYTPQEYLDREYDYHLDFFLKGDKWIYIIVDVNILGWSKRIENITL